MKLANANPEKGLYVGLRLDGRVRASGTGSPNWQKMIKELPPVTGMPQMSFTLVVVSYELLYVSKLLTSLDIELSRLQFMLYLNYCRC